MTMSNIYVPIKRELYDDIVRFSDGKLNPALLIDDQIEAWVVTSLEFFPETWGERALEVAEKYAPHIAARWEEEDRASVVPLANRRPLVWKAVNVPHGSDVRMTYGDQQFYGTVEDGKIKDADGTYSPSEWASKIAAGTSRNAWRDLWFREPLSKNWVPAMVLRNLAKTKQTGALETGSFSGGSDE